MVSSSSISSIIGDPQLNIIPGSCAMRATLFSLGAIWLCPCAETELLKGCVKDIMAFAVLESSDGDHQLCNAILAHNISSGVASHCYAATSTLSTHHEHGFDALKASSLNPKIQGVQANNDRALPPNMHQQQ